MQVTTAYKTKTVLYGGAVLRVNAWVKYIATDKDGTVHGFLSLPTAYRKKGVWSNSLDVTTLSAQVEWTYREQDSGAWLHSLRACGDDESWMLITTGKVYAALDLYNSGQQDAAREVFKEVAKRLEYVAWNKELDLQELYKTFITHACVYMKEDSDAEVELRQMVIPKPSYRKIQYHGATIFVPIWAKWIATDYIPSKDTGIIVVFSEPPIRRPDCFDWECTETSDFGEVGWLPPTEAKAAWEEEPQRVEDLEVK